MQNKPSWKILAILIVLLPIVSCATPSIAIDNSTNNALNQFDDVFPSESITANNTPFPLSQNTIYVPDNYEKIQWAVDNATAGDTIIVKSGTYYESVNVNKQLILRGMDTGIGLPVVDAGRADYAFILHVDGSLLEGFTVTNASFCGIHVRAYNAAIANNAISNISGYGISLESGFTNTITNNTIGDISGYGTSLWYGHGISLFYSSNNTLSGNTIANISGSKLSYPSGSGITLWYSSNNTLNANTITNTSKHGIYLEGGSNNPTSNNTLSGNTISTTGREGIYLKSYSTNNTLSGNTIKDTVGFGCGIKIGQSSSNTISCNTISNGHYGFKITDSSGNTIYLNDCINNTNNVSSYHSINIWNSTSPITYTYNGSEFENYLGNYWDDYTDTDANGDGIWDNSYIIDGDLDYYPLKGRFENYIINETINNPPNLPTTLAQFKSDSATVIPVGGTTDERTVVFKGTVSDPDGDKVILQVELRRLDEYGGQFDETEGGLKDSVLVESGSEAVAYADGLIDADYRWRARAVDEHGEPGEWVDFGNNGISEADFTVVSENMNPICKIELRKQGTTTSINEVNIWEFFDIYVGDSTDDTGITEVRFSSDESQDGNPTGEWTKWFNWDSSSEDWNASAKTKSWAFDNPGDKEVWAEVKDGDGEVNRSHTNIFVQPGYAIIVAGQGFGKWGIDHSANNAYRALRNLGFDDDHIFYLNSNGPQDVDGDGDDEVDALALRKNFTDTVLEVKQKMGDDPSPFVLYLVGHGSQGKDAPEVFFFEFVPKGEGEEGPLNPTALKTLLSVFPSETPMLIVIGSCYSGAFIAGNEGISIPHKNRVIITAAHLNKRPLLGWVRNSDRFWGYLNNGMDVKEAFTKKAWPSDILYSWLDDNGDKIGRPPNNLGDDGELAAKMHIGIPSSENLELEYLLYVRKLSPGELRVYDSQNRVTGLVNGEVKEEIPNSIYDEESETVAIFSSSDSYRHEIVGTDEGTYGLDIASIEDGDATTFTATAISTSPNATHEYTVNWTILSQGGAGVTLKIDADGDGEFEETITIQPPIANFTYTPKNPVINQTITFDASNSTDLDGNITSYTWDFADGTNGTGEKPSHSYSSAGNYTVTLTVRDDDGATTSTSKTITIYSPIFDTGSPANPYPSIMGKHTGTIKPNHTVIATKLYTYPCEGTGGHTEYAEIQNATWNATATWEGYAGDWHNITFDKTVVLLANEPYNYTIHTGSYPQIHHNRTLLTANGWINSTEFVDVNGRVFYGGIPAIRLWI